MINFLARKASIEVKTYHHFFSIEPQFFNQKSYTVHQKMMIMLNPHICGKKRSNYDHAIYVQIVNHDQIRVIMKRRKLYVNDFFQWGQFSLLGDRILAHFRQVNMIILPPGETKGERTISSLGHRTFKLWIFQPQYFSSFLCKYNKCFIEHV